MHPKIVDILKTTPSRGNSGAADELIVCADLLSKGYEVFRSVGPNSKADIVARIGSENVVFIEVRSKFMLVDGTVRVSTAYESDNCDLYAIVVDGQAVYLDRDFVMSNQLARKRTGRPPGATITPPPYPPYGLEEIGLPRASSEEKA